MRKICILVFILVLSIFMSGIISFNINATVENETITEESNANFVEGEDEGEASITSSGEGYNPPDNHGEEWYILSTEEPVFGNDEAIDYSSRSELLTHLKPGDIIYETNDSIVGDFTGHIAIIYDILWDEEYQQYYVSIIEAYRGGVGYSIMTPNRFEGKDVIIYRLTNANETQIQGALNWLVGKCGDSFKFHNNKFLDGLIETDDEGNETTYWYCAELIWAAYYRQEIYLDWDDNNNGGSLISPHALALNSQLTTILHYTVEYDEDKYETILTNNGATGHTYTCDGDTYTEEHFYRFWNPDEETHTATCACEYSIEVEHHFACRYPNMRNHSVYCVDCGYVQGIENHTFEYTNTSGSEHTKTCSGCGYTITEAHEYTDRYSSMDSNYHRGICECNVSKITRHTFDEDGENKICADCGYEIAINHIHLYTYTPLVGNRHRKTCSCGDSATEGCMGRTSIDGTSYCINCGREMAPFPEFFSLEDEEDALLMGIISDLPPDNKEDEYYSD